MQEKLTKLILTMLTVLLLTGVLAASTPATAQPVDGGDPTSEQTGPATENGLLNIEDHIIVERFTIFGVHVSTKAYSHAGQELPLPKGFQSVDSVSADQSFIDEVMEDNSHSGGEVRALGSGTGGTSLPHGCIRVSVRNEAETVLGFTAYWYVTWTKWCWNRGRKIISNVSTGFYLEDVDPLQYWHGQVNLSEYHFAWYSGYSKSGYYHERQGHFQNCITRIGCLSSTFPRNILYSYSNGTWSWHTSGN